MMESQHKAGVVVEQKKDAIFVLGRKRMVTMRQRGAQLWIEWNSTFGKL